MTKWDYYSCAPREGEDDLALLRRMGQDGWEVCVFAVAKDGTPFYWFKRPIIEQ